MSNKKADSHLGVARTVAALRARVSEWRRDGQTIAFAPTMGALHKGHLSLVTKGRAIADRTIASIFVNPAQFAAHEDLSTYPRNEAADCDLLQEAGCDLAYIPGADQMYPDGYQTSVAISELSQGLCGASRPHFFGGVATVVCKLLNQCRPDYAIFGEKDYQQLLIIRRMVRDLDMDVKIVGAPIVRESDGLAMSSRNAYLSADERAIAGKLNGALSEMAAALSAGEDVAQILSAGRADLAARGFDNIDYLDLRDAEDLALQTDGVVAKPARLLAAAMVGKTRLIDNLAVTPKD
ncbi:MAG: pantoate--beta-alanine ligase [Pseudomonadota bacterium]